MTTPNTAPSLVAQRMRDFFTAKSITANVVVGWREPGKRINQGPGQANRVVITPGDDAGNGGRLVGTRKMTTNPAPIATFAALLTFSVWAHDPTNPNDEELQIAATWQLLENVLRALRWTVQADAKTQEQVPVKWTKPVDRSFGRELSFQLVVSGPLFGETYNVVMPTVISPPTPPET